MKEQTLAIQYPTKLDYCNQQVPFFDPSFFKYKRYFHYFFLPEDTQITLETIKSQQKQDPVLQKVYHWLEIIERPLQLDPTIASNSFLSVYYKLFNQLYINHDTKIIHIDFPNIHDSNQIKKKYVYHLNSFKQLSVNFMHMDTLELTYLLKLLINFYFLPYLNKWMSIFIHDCIECQQNKHIIQKIRTAQYRHFQKVLHISITEYQWIQKDL